MSRPVFSVEAQALAYADTFNLVGWRRRQINELQQAKADAAVIEAARADYQLSRERLRRERRALAWAVNWRVLASFAFCIAVWGGLAWALWSW